jgi:hypothetical protein
MVLSVQREVGMNKQSTLTAKAPEYVIETVDDFLKVPEDRQAACIAEFADFLAIARGLDEAVASLSGIFGAAVHPRIGPFIWIDDGKKDRTISIQCTTPDNPAER